MHVRTNVLVHNLPQALHRQRSIVELGGIGADIWQGIDAQMYSNQLRDEMGSRCVMTTATLDELLTQAERLTPEEQLILLARLADHVRLVYANQLTPPKKMTITERLAEAGSTGRRLFKTAEEVDAYIREERDSWER